MSRVQSYDIQHNKERAWNTLSDMIKHTDIDLSIMVCNRSTVGDIPNDIKGTLRGLKRTIEIALREEEE